MIFERKKLYVKNSDLWMVNGLEALDGGPVQVYVRDQVIKVHLEDLVILDDETEKRGRKKSDT